MDNLYQLPNESEEDAPEVQLSIVKLDIPILVMRVESEVEIGTPNGSQLIFTRVADDGRNICLTDEAQAKAILARYNPDTLYQMLFPSQEAWDKALARKNERDELRAQQEREQESE